MKRPTQPGKPPDSDQNLAVRARRIHEDDGGLARTPATERDAYKRARGASIVSGGRLTQYGEWLLNGVDRSKVEILRLLTSDGESTRESIGERLGSAFSADTVDAALLDLELSGEVHHEVRACESCGKTQARYELTH